MTISQAVANTFLRLSFDENISITPMKLQKLLFFSYAEYYKKTKTPLFSEQFQAWDYGPVLASVYYEFNSFRSGKITKFARDAKGNVFVVGNTDTVLNEVIRGVWNKYKHFSGTELSDITHRNGSAWSIAKESHHAFISLEDIENAKE